MSNSVDSLFGDCFTVGVHSSRPGGICSLPSSDAHLETLLYTTGQELRTLSIDQSENANEKVKHDKFSTENHTGCVAAVTCNDSHVLSCDYDGEVKLWSAKKGDLLSTVDVSTAGSKQALSQESASVSSSSSYSPPDTQLSSLKSESVSLSANSTYAAVAAEGIFTLFLFRIQVR